MADDLVKRLRESAEEWDDCEEAHNAFQDREAADRIEELEAALRKIAQHDMWAIAIDALHPKERIRPTAVESTNG